MQMLAEGARRVRRTGSTTGRTAHEVQAADVGGTHRLKLDATTMTVSNWDRDIQR